MSDVIKFPFGPADNQTPSATSGTINVAVKNNCTLVNLATSTTATLALNADAELEDGAVVHVKNVGTGTEVLSFGGDALAPAITNAAGKTVVQGFIYNKTAGKFYPFGAKIQVN